MQASSDPLGELPPTILDSFKEKVYVFEPESNIEYKPVQPSGATTNATDPPEYLISTPISRFVRLANKVLSNKRLKDRALHTRRMSEKRSEMKQSSETGTVIATQTYILDPVTEVLHIMFLDQWESRPEYSKKPGDKTDDLDANVRLDLAFINAETGELMASFEFKKRGLIDYEDASDAIVSKDAPQTVKDNKSQEAQENEVATLLLDNGMTFGKQVRAYAETYQCGNIALFNWDHLLLFGFKFQGDEATLTPTVAWVKEDGGEPGESHIQEGLFRTVLLGWLVSAFQEAGLESPYMKRVSV